MPAAARRSTTPAGASGPSQTCMRADRRFGGEQPVGILEVEKQPAATQARDDVGLADDAHGRRGTTERRAPGDRRDHRRPAAAADAITGSGRAASSA